MVPLKAKRKISNNLQIWFISTITHWMNINIYSNTRHRRLKIHEWVNKEIEIRKPQFSKWLPAQATFKISKVIYAAMTWICKVAQWILKVVRTLMVTSAFSKINPSSTVSVSFQIKKQTSITNCIHSNMQHHNQMCKKRKPKRYFQAKPTN